MLKTTARSAGYVTRKWLKENNHNYKVQSKTVNMEGTDCIFVTIYANTDNNITPENKQITFEPLEKIAKEK